MTVALKSEETKRKIIEAAGKTFAESGYEAATVRQITDRAGVNLCAVNYHFGDKSNLYREVLLDGIAEMQQRLLERCASGDPQERLHRYVEELVRIAFLDDRPWKWIVMIREMSGIYESSELADVIAEAIKPNHQLLLSIIRDLSGPDVSAENLEGGAQLVIGMLVHLIHGKGFIRRLSTGITFDPSEMESVVERLYAFALAGIGSLKNVPQMI
jgi:AcrR family transcriptional regulator